ISDRVPRERLCVRNLDREIRRRGNNISCRRRSRAFPNDRYTPGPNVRSFCYRVAVVAIRRRNEGRAVASVNKIDGDEQTPYDKVRSNEETREQIHGPDAASSKSSQLDCPLRDPTHTYVCSTLTDKLRGSKLRSGWHSVRAIFEIKQSRHLPPNESRYPAAMVLGLFT